MADSTFIRVNPAELVPWAHVKIEDADAAKGHMMDQLAYCTNPGQQKSKKTIATFNIVVNKKLITKICDENTTLDKIGPRNLYLALVLHEIAHIRYGSFATTLKALTAVQFHIFNLLEDMRIEYHMGYDYTSLAPYLKLINMLLKFDPAKIDVKEGVYDSERKLFNRLLTNLYKFVRFGLLPEDKESQEFVNFAFPYVMTAQRGALTDAVNSTIAICTKLDNMLMESALAKPEAQRPSFVKGGIPGVGGGGPGSGAGTGSGGIPVGSGNTASTTKSGVGGGASNTTNTPEEELKERDISGGLQDHTGNVVWKDASSVAPVSADEPEEDKDLKDTMNEDDEAAATTSGSSDDSASSGPQIEIDFSEGEQHPLYDPKLKNTPTPSVAADGIVSAEEFEDLNNQMEQQSGSGTSFIDQTAKDFFNQVQANDPSDPTAGPVRLPGQTNNTWENHEQSRNLSGGGGADVEVMIVGESNETFFYRCTVEERIGTISRMRKAMRDMFRKPYTELAFEGDLSPMKQQEAYLGSKFGEDTKSYNVRKMATRSLDVAILRDISGSTASVMREYAEAVVVFLESLEGIDEVQTGMIDFESNYVVIKRFNEPLRSSRIFPVSRGGTQIDGAMREVVKWNWKADNRLVIIITDGGLYSYSMDEHNAAFAAKNIKPICLGIGYTSPLPGIPLFMTTVDHMPQIMGSLVKNYLLYNRIPTQDDLKILEEEADGDDGQTQP